MAVSLPALLFGLRAPVGRRAYALAGVTLMAVKYTTDALLVYLWTGRVFHPLDYLNPILAMRAEAVATEGTSAAPQALLLLLALLALPYLWIGLSMTMRRAVDAGRSPWWAFLFFAPVVNLALMVTLALLPSRAVASGAPSAPAPVVDARLRSALVGLVAGLAIAGAMTLLSVFVLGAYGASLFMGTPLVMGAAAAWLHNRDHPRRQGETIVVALTSVFMAGAALLLFALEGILCLTMALPIAAVLAVAGALVGRTIALGAQTARAHPIALLLGLPLASSVESAVRDLPVHEVETAREIDAPPEVVWRHVVSFSELPPPTEWFFTAGIAYPKRARMEGTGVGAVRYCEFSTGAFVEPITTWDAPRRLAFDVRSQPEPMTELSPYAFVNAPHLDDALRSRRGEFRLVPLDGGSRTRLEGSTWYTLDMGPTTYWRLWSDALLHAIHGRVLDHIAHLAEADVSGAQGVRSTTGQ